jgi:SAM-dependent methyltransferase
MWAAVAPAWGEHADDGDDRGAPLTERMLELAAPAAGDRVLELACGAGGLGLAAAERVGPDGAVVLSDVVDEMTQIAATRASSAGLRNVTTRVLDLEQIAEPDATYDAVLCREGLMFALDPRVAAGEILRVLRPGGRFVAAVWGPRERNPWLGVVFDAASAQLGRPVPPPGIPGPFALSDRAELDSVLRDAGFTEVSVEELALTRGDPSLDEWWQRTASLAGPLAVILGSLPPDEREQVRRRALEGARIYVTDDGVEFPAVSLVATGRRPDA